MIAQLKRFAVLLVLCTLGTTSALAQPSQNVEVLHWWTSGSEAKAVQVIKQMMENQGVHWQDFAVPGGAGESAMTVLKSRAISGNPPAAAQIKGPAIQEWASLGFLTNLDGVAKAQNWDQLIPELITQDMKFHGHYVAVPINIHRINWLWINSAIFAKAHAKIPTTWKQFFAVAEKIKQAGYPVLAQGNQDWQTTTVFESIALSQLGVKGYRQAFIEHIPQVLTSPAMVRSFEILQKMRPYIVHPNNHQSWNQATAEVIHNQAAMQIIGDWANGEFLLAHKKVGKDIRCVPVPGTAHQFIYSVDSFAMFQLTEPNDIKAQQLLAHTIMSPELQTRFNQIKGSIPVRSDIKLTGFDSCSLKSEKAFKHSLQAHTAVPSIAHGMATTSYVQSAILDVVNNFFNTPDASPKQASEKLMRAILAAS